MKELIIKFAPFVLKQSVFIKDGDKIIEEKIPQKEIASFVSAQENVKKIHFFGNETYARKIAAEVTTKYGMTDIEMLFNK